MHYIDVCIYILERRSHWVTRCVTEHQNNQACELRSSLPKPSGLTNRACELVLVLELELELAQA